MKLTKVWLHSFDARGWSDVDMVTCCLHRAEISSVDSGRTQVRVGFGLSEGEQDSPEHSIYATFMAEYEGSGELSADFAWTTAVKDVWPHWLSWVRATLAWMDAKSLDLSASCPEQLIGHLPCRT